MIGKTAGVVFVVLLLVGIYLFMLGGPAIQGIILEIKALKNNQTDIYQLKKNSYSNYPIFNENKILNNRPIIGVLSQGIPHNLDPILPQSHNFSSYIAASYVKYLEMAGARVVPVIVGKEKAYYEGLFSSLNGLLLPGGDTDLLTSNYARTAHYMFDLAKKANLEGDVFPLWGTCQGFEMLAILSRGWRHSLTDCRSEPQLLPLIPLDGWQNSRLYGQAPSEVLSHLTTLPITLNFHTRCLTMENFTRYDLENFWTPLSINTDLDGLDFISSMEAKQYPFFATQFHPEKSPFEWTDHIPDLDDDISHSREAVNTAYYMAQFFVNYARQSNHSFIDRKTEEEELIFKHKTWYTGHIWTFQQVYLFFVK